MLKKNTLRRFRDEGLLRGTTLLPAHDRLLRFTITGETGDGWRLPG